MGILKKFLFGEENTSEKAQKVVKDKKLGLLEKYLQVKNLYIEYFKHQVDYDAKNALYELHYEKIYKNLFSCKRCAIITIKSESP